MSHGWDPLQIYKEIGPAELYQVYVKIYRRDAEVYYGNIVLLQENKVVAFFKRVLVSSLTRSVDGHP